MRTILFILFFMTTALQGQHVDTVALGPDNAWGKKEWSGENRSTVTSNCVTSGGDGVPRICHADIGSGTVFYFVPYQTSDGSWRLRGNIHISLTTARASSQNFYINGIRTKSRSDANFRQPATAYVALTEPTRASFVDGSNVVNVAFGGGGTLDHFNVSFDVRLETKPEWF